MRFLLSVLAGLLLGWAGWLLAGTDAGPWLSQQGHIAKELRPFVGALLVGPHFGYKVL